MRNQLKLPLIALFFLPSILMGGTVTQEIDMGLCCGLRTFSWKDGSNVWESYLAWRNDCRSLEDFALNVEGEQKIIRWDTGLLENRMIAETGGERPGSIWFSCSTPKATVSGYLWDGETLEEYTGELPKIDVAINEQDESNPVSKEYRAACQTNLTALQNKFNAPLDGRLFATSCGKPEITGTPGGGRRAVSQMRVWLVRESSKTSTR